MMIRIERIKKTAFQVDLYKKRICLTQVKKEEHYEYIRQMSRK